jgi:hypothetical protein
VQDKSNPAVTNETLQGYLLDWVKQNVFFPWGDREKNG